jgi:hypothetical protein
VITAEALLAVVVGTDLVAVAATAAPVLRSR